MSIDLRDELRRKYGSKPPVQSAPPVAAAPPVVTPVGTETEKAFVVHAESGRTVITGPIREVAMVNQGFTYLKGRFVEADSPNSNGALWTTGDLQLGQSTVAGGPLNWLHDENHVIGSFLDGALVSGREDAAVGNHIVSTAAVWRFLFPKEADTIERAAADHQLFFSMECISKEVACIDTPGRPGCGEHFSYADYDSGRACAHLRERSSVRRFVDPIFLGGAIIVPPIRPGWANAEAGVVRQAAALSESAHLASGDLTGQQALDLATAVLQWANRT